MNINNNYQYRNSYNTNFSGIADLQKLKELKNRLEPETLKRFASKNFDDAVQEWLSIPNEILDRNFKCHDLNLRLKRLNIESIIRKRGLSEQDMRLYDVKDYITHDIYDFAEMLARDTRIELPYINFLLMRISEGEFSKEFAFRAYKTAVDGIYGKNGTNKSSQANNTTTTPSQKRITEEEFVAHITKKLAQSDFKKSSLNKAEIHNLSLLLKTSVDQILNMDKKEYRRLANIYHVDGTNFCGKDYFSIVDTLYKAQ